MRKNLGKVDRMLRAAGAVAMVVGAAVLPVSLELRLALGVSGIYVLMTALWGTCLGYRLLGMSTCPAGSR